MSVMFEKFFYNIDISRRGHNHIVSYAIVSRTTRKSWANSRVPSSNPTTGKFVFSIFFNKRLLIINYY